MRILVLLCLTVVFAALTGLSGLSAWFALSGIGEAEVSLRVNDHLWAAPQASVPLILVAGTMVLAYITYVLMEAAMERLGRVLPD